MKKKSPRGIPDFSRKGPQSGPLAKQGFQKPQAPQAPQRVVNVKPQATSSKSGQRGT